jgi:hypothetical protein
MPEPESGKKRAGKPLRVADTAFIGGAMKIRHISAVLALALLSGCDKPAEVSVDETRPVTMRDAGHKLNATSSDRFEEPGTGPYLAGVVPEGWLAQPTSAFRLLSYRFGTGGDIAVGVSSGGMLENVNRWLGQFGADPIDEAGLEKLEKGEAAGAKGVWVEAAGDYSPGMGQPPKASQALYGLVAVEGDRIVTIKMTGPADEVAAQKSALKVFAASLRKRAE